MGWLRKNWQWTALNLFALAVMIFVVTRKPVYWDGIGKEIDPILESGKWGLRFLLFSLAMTPLNRYFGWRTVIPLRKPAGLWAFGFGVAHLVMILVYDGRLGVYWLTFPLLTFITLGLIALTMLSLMAITSNRWAMRWLGKGWKRLHRLVYIASLLIVIHALLATESSKKLILAPGAAAEVTIYLIILLILLIARLPPVRNALQRFVPARRLGTA